MHVPFRLVLLAFILRCCDGGQHSSTNAQACDWFRKKGLSSNEIPSAATTVVFWRPHDLRGGNEAQSSDASISIASYNRTEMLQRADRLRKDESRPSDALELYREVIKRENGRDADALGGAAAVLITRQETLKEARGLLEQALDIAPTDARVLHGLGVAEWTASLNATAASCFFERAICLDPSNARSRCALAYMQEEQGRASRADEIMREALEVLPSHPEIACDYGALLGDRPKADEIEAEALFRRAERLDPSSVAPLYNRAQLRARKHDLDGAEPILRRAFALQAGNTRTLCSLAHLAARRNRPSAAQRLLERALTIDPSCGTAYFQLAELAHANEARTSGMGMQTRGKEREAHNLSQTVELYRKAVEACELVSHIDHEGAWGASPSLIVAAKYSHATALLSDLRTRMSVAHTMARVARKSSDTSGAPTMPALSPSTICRSSAHTKPKSAFEGRPGALAGAPEGADQARRHATATQGERMPSPGNKGSGLGDFLDLAGDGGGEGHVTVDDEAETVGRVRKLLREVLLLQPNHTPSLLLLGQIIHAWDQQLDRAEELYRQAAESNPACGEALGLVALARLSRPLPADVVLRRRSLATSGAILRHAEELAPQALTPVLVRGAFLFYTQHNASGAADLLRRAAEIAPDDELALWHYAACLWQLERYEEALQIVSKLRQLRLMVGYGLSASEARDEAQSLISHLRSTDPKIVKLTTIIHAVEDEFKGGKIAKLDKRLLTDSEWSTTIGRQAGTVFNIPQLQAFGRLQGSTPEEQQHYALYNSRKRPAFQIQDQRPVVEPADPGRHKHSGARMILSGAEAAGFSDAGFPRSIVRSMRADLSSEAHHVSCAAPSAPLPPGDDDQARQTAGYRGDEAEQDDAEVPGGREYAELVGETKLVAGSASDIATAVRQRKASFAKKKHDGDGARARPQIAASEGLMENPAGGQKGSTRLCPKAAWEQGIDPEGRAAETCAADVQGQFEQVMAAIERHHAPDASLDGYRRQTADPAGALLEASEQAIGYSVRISGLHEDVDNDALFSLLRSIGTPASDVDVPFDLDTGESFGYGVATFTNRMAAAQVITTLNAASPADVTPPGESLKVEMMPWPRRVSPGSVPSS